MHDTNRNDRKVNRKRALRNEEYVGIREFPEVKLQTEGHQINRKMRIEGIITPCTWLVF